MPIKGCKSTKGRFADDQAVLIDVTHNVVRLVGLRDLTCNIYTETAK